PDRGGGAGAIPREDRPQNGLPQAKTKAGLPQTKSKDGPSEDGDPEPVPDLMAHVSLPSVSLPSVSLPSVPEQPEQQGAEGEQPVSGDSLEPEPLGPLESLDSIGFRAAGRGLAKPVPAGEAADLDGVVRDAANQDGLVLDGEDLDVDTLAGLEPALCEDPRWSDFLRRLKEEPGTNELYTHLRRSEVVNLDGETVEITPPDGMARSQLEKNQSAWGDTAALHLAAAFGQGVRLKVNHDTKRIAREERTPVGRERLREESLRQAQREQAENHEQVVRVLRFFPKGKIKSVKLSDPEPKWRKDV
ncbi:MAG: hypothetical protein OEW12_08930, partial [Deltaproteobacteria bacterium]|nr:hypothetical protein [Deltaproteobacteria bacterium]